MTEFRTPKAKRLKLAPISIPPSPFLEKLGYGTGVNVWKLQPSPKSQSTKSPWAIKNVRQGINKTLSRRYQSLIKKEAKILKTLDHENIIGFRGYLESADGRNCLAMEIGGESLGNLVEKRLDEDLGPFPAKTILKVGYNIAKALKYLHTEKNILHGDIKSYNIVIKGDFEVIKLCDFGVSVNLDEKGVAHGFVGTPLYSAPECQEDSDDPVTAKADIFSFGLVLWEMIALYPPHTQPEESSDSEEDGKENESFMSNSSEEADFMSKLEEKFGTRPPLPSVNLGEEYSPVIEVFYCCTEKHPDKRPTADSLTEYLKAYN